jgi:methyl-accepting chemotaxis protein
MTSIELEDANAKVTELEEKNAHLADDLDVANSKAEQLRKAEATVVSYRKKLENLSVMTQQMTQLENQAASYLKQIVELENETKKIPTMIKTIDELRECSCDTARKRGRRHRRQGICI